MEMGISNFGGELYCVSGGVSPKDITIITTIIELLNLTILIINIFAASAHEPDIDN